MPAIVTFDFADRRIIEISAAGDNTLNVDEIYSEWKIAAQTGNNLGVAPAFSTRGGDTTPTGSLGATYFLENGWKIRPAELDHRLILVGNLYSADGSRVSADTLGAYTVEVAIQFSNLIDRFDTLANKNLIYPLYGAL